jgi:hypothetical protein
MANQKNFDKENVQVFMRMLQVMAAEPELPMLIYPIGHQPHFLNNVAVDELYTIARRRRAEELEVKRDMSVLTALLYRHAFDKGYAHAKRETNQRS